MSFTGNTGSSYFNNTDPAVQSYATALQNYFSPYFQQQQQGLEGTLASEGILSSGAGNQAFQDLTARNNAAYSQALLPLIQQGYGQTFQQGQLGAEQNFQAMLANQQFANQYNLAALGYAMDPYLGALQGLYGLQPGAMNNQYAGATNTSGGAGVGQGIGTALGYYGQQAPAAGTPNPYAYTVGSSGGYTPGGYAYGDVIGTGDIYGSGA